MVREARHRPRGIGHLDREALGVEEAHHPASHLAGPADHEHAPARAAAGRDDALLLLDRERGANEEQQDLLGQLGRGAEPGGGGARALEHLALLVEVARRPAGAALRLADLGGQRLPARDQGEQLAVDGGEPATQLFEAHGGRT